MLKQTRLTRSDFPATCIISAGHNSDPSSESAPNSDVRRRGRLLSEAGYHQIPRARHHHRAAVTGLGQITKTCHSKMWYDCAQPILWELDPYVGWEHRYDLIFFHHQTNNGTERGLKRDKCPCHSAIISIMSRQKHEQKQGYSNFFLRRLLADVVGGTSGTRWVFISQIWSASRYTSYFLILSSSSVLCNQFITVCNNKGMFAGISIIRLLCKRSCVGESIQNNQIKLSWYLAPIEQLLYLKYSWYLTSIGTMCWR